MKASFLPLLLTGCLMEVDVGDPPVDDPDPQPGSIDQDADGVPLEEDCDDRDDRRGDVAELCDNVDNDCDYVVDEGVCDRLDVFVQSTRLDVLFVVDTSSSMQPHLDRLAAGIGTFLAPLHGSDVHVGVVSMTDTAQPKFGELVRTEGRQFLPMDDPKLDLEAAVQWFGKALAEPPVVTGADASGKLAVMAAFPRDPPDLDWNPGFLRGETPFEMVFVSDRDDVVDPNLAALVEHLMVVKGTSANATAHTIVQTDDYACDGTLSPTTLGAQYLGLSNGTQGLDTSVCDATFDLAQVGTTVANEGLGNRFTLARPARVGTVAVLIVAPDGAEWSYPSDGIALGGDGRTVVLVGFDVPSAGSTLLISYDCDPELGACE